TASGGRLMRHLLLVWCEEASFHIHPPFARIGFGGPGTDERLRNKCEAQSYKHNRHSECRFRNVARKRNLCPYSAVNANDLHGNIVSARPASFSRAIGLWNGLDWCRFMMNTASSTRLPIPIFSKIRKRLFFTVCSLIFKLRPIWRLLCPAATRIAMSNSRLVRFSPALDGMWNGDDSEKASRTSRSSREATHTCPSRTALMHFIRCSIG